MKADKKLLVPVAFALVYVLWGSTYLAIRYSVQTIPPFLMAGFRFLLAGTIVYGWTRLRGGAKPTLKQWKNASVAGICLLVLANGVVSWAEMRVTSSVTALIVALVPIWIVVLDWVTGGARPTARAWVGLAMGLLGVVILVGPNGKGGGVDPLGAAALVFASVAWSYGTIFGRRADLPKSALMTTGMEMLCGGAALFVVAFATGEGAQFSLAAVSRASLIGLSYLIVFGAIVGYSAYTYLVNNTTPAKLGTYAFVNPCIAVFLGWLIADEPIGPRTLIAVLVIVGAVVLLTVKPAPKPKPAAAYATR